MCCESGACGLHRFERRRGLAPRTLQLFGSNRFRYTYVCGVREDVEVWGRGAQICEEAPAQLEVEVPLGAKAERPSNALVPRLLQLFGSPVEDAKCLAVSILNLLAGGMPQALADNMETCAPLIRLTG